MNIMKKLLIRFFIAALIIPPVLFLPSWFVNDGTVYGLMLMLKTYYSILSMVMFPFAVIAIIMKGARVLGKAKRKAGQLDKTDFNFDKKYYREILEVNSPIILGCLDNFDVDENKLVAQLFYMKEKEMIKIVNGNLEINTDFNNADASEPEKMILNRIIKGRLRIENYYDFIDRLRNVTMREAERAGLVEKKKKEKKKRTFLIVSIILIMIILMLSIIFSAKSIERLIALCSVAILFGAILLLGMIASYIYDSAKLGHQYIRTEKGKELNEKIDGLKIYLNEYSKISERDSNEIELWKEYLIYSVMFGQNQKVFDEYVIYIEVE